MLPRAPRRTQAAPAPGRPGGEQRRGEALVIPDCLGSSRSAPASLPASSGCSLSPDSSPWSPPPPAPGDAAAPPWRPRATPCPAGAHVNFGARPRPLAVASWVTAARPFRPTLPPGVREEQLHPSLEQTSGTPAALVPPPNRGSGCLGHPRASA